MALLLFGAAGQPQLITKFLMLKDAKELKWGALVTGIAYGVTSLFSVGIGLAMKAMVITGAGTEPGTIDNTTTEFLSQFTHPVVAGLALTALLAAIMSSASSFITIGVAAVVRDSAYAFGIRVKRELTWSRVWAGVITVVSVLVVFYLSEVIFILGAFGWAAFAAAILGPVALGVYWRKGTGTGAFWAVATAIASNLFVTIAARQEAITIPSHIHIGGASLMVSLLVYIVVSLISTNPERETHFDDFMNRSYEQNDPVETPVTGRAGAKTNYSEGAGS